ncbi:MAG: ATP-binding protein [Gammaproteobacteria bacterium]
MNILCRSREVKLLEKILASKKPEFLAVYGRRRVGKTHLICSFFEGKNCIFFNVMGTKDGPYKDQIAHFTYRIGEVFLGGITPKQGNNWDEAFQMLRGVMAQTPKNKKIVIFLDELPWMATRKSNLLQTIDYYWNQYWSREARIKLIVCGSSASWIIHKIINNKGGLYNRVTEIIHLKPFNLAETEYYLQSSNIKLNRRQVTELYMVTGGVPFYLSKFEPGYSATQLTEKLVFSPKAVLLNEFNALFESLFDNADAYIEIVKLIAKHREGIGQQELFKKLIKSPKGETSLKRVKELEETGFIISFIPHFHAKRGIYYRIEDEYTLFYLFWIDSIKSTKVFKAFEPGYWKTLTQTSKWFAWAGYAFEAICYKHLVQIRKALDLPSTAIPNSWRYVPKGDSGNKGAQIDLLFDRNDNSITICEIKFSNKVFEITKEYAQKLKQKVEVFKKITGTQKQIFIAMIAANGVKKNKHSNELINHVVTLEELFKMVE